MTSLGDLTRREPGKSSLSPSLNPGPTLLPSVLLPVLSAVKPNVTSEGQKIWTLSGQVSQGSDAAGGGQRGDCREQSETTQHTVSIIIPTFSSSNDPLKRLHLFKLYL